MFGLNSHCFVSYADSWRYSIHDASNFLANIGNSWSKYVMPAFLQAHLGFHFNFGGYCLRFSIGI